MDGEALGVWGSRGALGYHVFDLLWCDGRDLTGSTLDERHDALCRLELSPPLYRVERLDEPRPMGARLPARAGRESSPSDVTPDTSIVAPRIG